MIEMNALAAVLLKKRNEHTMILNDNEQQTLALAGTLQSLYLMHQVAAQGEFDSNSTAAVLQPLAFYNPEDTLSAFGGHIDRLQIGLRQLQRFFGDSPNRDIAQYVMPIVSIELKLVKDMKMRQILQNAMQKTVSLLHNDEAIDDDNAPALSVQLTSAALIEHFARTYKNTASNIAPRIMVKGQQSYLQNESSANQIRALLLAALRSIAFFRHYGGKRIDFMLKRKQFVTISRQW